MTLNSSLPRCAWCGTDKLNVTYHDEEWGVPVFDDHHLFECLILEGAQAGLSWTTILKKRGGYREAFHGFNIRRISEMSESEQEALRNFPGIVRNRLKISATVSNARAALELQQAHGSLCSYFWNFVDGKPIVNNWTSLSEIPAETEMSKRLSEDLKRRGFRFVGPTIMYAFMQAVGMVNDHEIRCFRHSVIAEKNASAPC